MDNQKPTLGDDVLAVCKRAYEEDNMEVAEHLLRALEVLAAKEDSSAIQETMAELTRLPTGQDPPQ
jgi:hypothetical protein